MTADDLCRFYFGNAEAIRRLAADPWTLSVGAILVLSAGLARHHDTHDLRRQWWRLLVPFAASTLAAAALFLVVVLVSRAGVAALPLGPGLLGLFWLTAPFAWLYGLPFERLWPPARAARARRLALAAVAACRVTLLARCVGLLLGYSSWAGLLIVACFAGPAALLASAATLLFVRRPEAVVSVPLPSEWEEAAALLSGSDPGAARGLEGQAVQGGAPPLPAVRQPEAARATAGPPRPAGPAVAGAAKKLVDFMSGVPLRLPDHLPPLGRPRFEPLADPAPGLALGCLAVVLLVVSSLLLPALIGPPRWPAGPAVPPAGPPAPAVWGIAALAVLFWVPWLALRQPAQRRRTVFVRRLRCGPVAEAVRDLAELRPGDLPPHWDPSAALARPVFAPRLLEAARVAAELPAGSWVRACFLGRLGQMLPVWLDPPESWDHKEDPLSEEPRRQLAGLLDLLRPLPEGPDLLRPYHDYLAELCASTRERDPPRSELLQDLLALALKRRAPA